MRSNPPCLVDSFRTDEEDFSLSHWDYSAQTQRGGTTLLGVSISPFWCNEEDTSLHHSSSPLFNAVRRHHPPHWVHLRFSMQRGGMTLLIVSISLFFWCNKEGNTSLHFSYSTQWGNTHWCEFIYNNNNIRHLFARMTRFYDNYWLVVSAIWIYDPTITLL